MTSLLLAVSKYVNRSCNVILRINNTFNIRNRKLARLEGKTDCVINDYLFVSHTSINQT